MNDKLNLTISIEDFNKVIETIRTLIHYDEAKEIIVFLISGLDEKSKRQFLDYYKE